MKKYSKLLKTLGLALMVGLWGSMVSCNSKDDPDEDSYVPAETVAVTGFTLQPDIRVMRNLDSVFFSIDLDHGVIFNADSLPKGTNVTKLVAKISYPSTVTSATIEMKGGTHREGSFNYFSNPNDTIDFTGDVTLTLGADRNNLTKTYRLKVNVHQEDPDTLYWDQTASMQLPSRLSSPQEQKTVMQGTQTFCLIKESNGSFTMSTSQDLFEGKWNKKELSLNFTPDVRTLTECAGKLFLLDSDGALYSSSDGISWDSTDVKWRNIIGEYDNHLVGITANGSEYGYEFYPNNLSGGVLPAGFPIEGFSGQVTISSKWATSPTMIITGGKSAEGQYTGSSWAFDGNVWAAISNTPMPELYAPTVMPYFAYLKSSSNSQLKEFNALLAFGGRFEDGSINETLYISYDYGLNWMKAPQYMQVPAGISIGYGADALPVVKNMNSFLSDRWKSAPERRGVNFTIDGDVISWECPYIFLFGGYESTGTLIPSIHTGVLRRLTFVPIF